MKRFLLLCISCLFSCALVHASGNVIHEDRALDKEVSKRVKQYKKEGWKVFNGAFSLEDQIKECFVKELSLDDNGDRRYISVSVNAIGNDLEEARMKARELAKMKIASSLGESIQGIISSKVVNEQLAKNEIRSSSELVAKCKARAVQKLGRIQPVVECWRVRPDKSMEMLMTIMYDLSEVHRIADDVIRNDYE